MSLVYIRFVTASLLAAVFLMLAACAPAPTPVPPTAVPTSPPPPTAAQAAQAAPQPKPVTLQLVKNDQLGTFLADGAGNTLYEYDADTPSTTNCYDKCAQVWPPLLPAGAANLKDGVDAALVGTTQRKDGTTQLTYNGWPLYYYAKDVKPGDTTGQAVGKVWWVLSAEGNPIKPAALKLNTNARLGTFLSDDKGHTIYMYTKDTKDTTVCYDKCEQAWPPVLELGKPTLGDGINASLLGTTRRKDGTVQVTYNGMPLYYYIKDAKPGDITGQGVSNVWYVIAPDGTVISNPAS